MKPLAELSLEELRQRIVHTFVAGGGSKPAVVVVRADDGEAVLKDYSNCSGLFAFLIAPLLVAREAAALRQLNLHGVPRLIRCPDRRSLLMERLQGVHKALWHPAGRTPEFEARLRTLLEKMHEQGVAHCDMRRASNILVDAQGQPYLVDFVSSVRRRPFWYFDSWFFRPLCNGDFNALAKLKTRARPHELTDEEREQATHSLLARIPRWIGARFRDLLRWLLIRD